MHWPMTFHSPPMTYAWTTFELLVMCPYMFPRISSNLAQDEILVLSPPLFLGQGPSDREDHPKTFAVKSAKWHKDHFLLLLPVTIVLALVVKQMLQKLQNCAV